jgi:hypothetical protein
LQKLDPYNFSYKPFPARDLFLIDETELISVALVAILTSVAVDLEGESSVLYRPPAEYDFFEFTLDKLRLLTGCS